jgi:inner membrane transporter RhtA
MNRAIASGGLMSRVPAPAFFLISAVFHYLGPCFAVLLFARIDVPGVAWLRIASAAAVFGLWRRPWRSLTRTDPRRLLTVVCLGAILAAMNLFFYLAIARLPLSTVGSIEFLGTVVLAAYGLRSKRNLAALLVTILGVLAITQVRFAGEPLGFAFAFANCALFVAYVALGHHVANGADNIDQLGAAMLVAVLIITPVGLRDALPAFYNASLLGAGILVGVFSSVIPYVSDQLAMARLPRATFALMLALLPVFATIIGALVLRQIPTLQDILGILLVTAGIAIHRQEVI